MIDLKIGERLTDFCNRHAVNEECLNFRIHDLKQSQNEKLIELAAYAWQVSDFEKKIQGRISGIEILEGLLVPGAYSAKSKSLIAILQAMAPSSVARIEKIKKNLPDSAPGKAGLKPADIIKLSSIVEKEAVTNHSYEKVARVFLNRIEKNEKLGSCPTVEYALGYHRPFLLFKDLELQSDYNVYKRRGLPPTAIAAFSDEALKATLNPAEGRWFFFVFDWTTGRLHFAEKYQDHKENARVARANYIEKYGKENMYKALPGVFYEYSEGEKRPEGPFEESQ